MVKLTGLVEENGKIDITGVAKIVQGDVLDIDGREEWMTTLDEMIECFEEQARSLNNIGGENFMDNWRKRREVQKKKLHRGLELLGKYWWDLR